MEGRRTRAGLGVTEMMKHQKQQWVCLKAEGRAENDNEGSWVNQWDQKKKTGGEWLTKRKLNETHTQKDTNWLRS